MNTRGYKKQNPVAVALFDNALLLGFRVNRRGSRPSLSHVDSVLPPRSSNVFHQQHQMERMHRRRLKVKSYVESPCLIIDGMNQDRPDRNDVSGGRRTYKGVLKQGSPQTPAFL